MSLDGSPHKTSLCIDRIDPLTNMLWPDTHRNLILYFLHKRWFSSHRFRIPWGLDEMWLSWIRRINCNICIYLEIFFSYCTSKYVLGIEKWKHPEFYLSRWPPVSLWRKSSRPFILLGKGCTGSLLWHAGFLSLWHTGFSYCRAGLSSCGVGLVSQRLVRF